MDKIQILSKKLPKKQSQIKIFKSLKFTYTFSLSLSLSLSLHLGTDPSGAPRGAGPLWVQFWFFICSYYIFYFYTPILTTKKSVKHWDECFCKIFWQKKKNEEEEEEGSMVRRQCFCKIFSCISKEKKRSIEYVMPLIFHASKYFPITHLSIL